jgi:phenylacetate-CoA ligase
MSSDVDTQLDWLEREQPHYLLCYPSTLVELASRSLVRGLRMPWLREVTTISEVLPADARELCRQAWGVPVTDIYSSQEVGQIALQCPECTHYHVQSEAVLVEVLNDTGQPCGAGELGRVVVTTLHNYAMPLVRYEIGDYAEPGSRCTCGRGLPVLQRVAGRARNLLVLADGRRYWPRLGSRMFVEVAPVLQAQYIQKDFDLIEVKLVVPQPLGMEQEERLRRMILEGLPAGMRITFSYCDRIFRGAGGKYEDFVSEIAPRR